MKVSKENKKKIEKKEILEEDLEKNDAEEVKELSEIDILKNSIVELEGQINTLKNDYARAYADTENTRKRLNAEFETSKKYRIQSFALDILPVIDNFERALEQEINEEYKKGIEMIYNQLMLALNKEGVTKMDPLNKEFDANYHQAIMSEKVEGVDPGMVVQVFQPGYMLKDRILRAAMVKVSE